MNYINRRIYSKDAKLLKQQRKTKDIEKIAEEVLKELGFEKGEIKNESK